MSRLYEWLAGLLVLAVLVLALFAFGYSHGVQHQKGIDDEATAERIAAETRAVAADRDTARSLATQYETERDTARSALAVRRPARVAALAASASCPASGSLGDVIVPAAVVRGVFVDDAADGSSAPRPAAAIAGRGLLDWRPGAF